MNMAQAVQPGSFDFSAAESLIQSAINERLLPGGVMLVGYHDQIVSHRAFGEMRYPEDGVSAEPIEKHTIFDLDRLTSALVTTSLLMQVTQSGRIGLD